MTEHREVVCHMDELADAFARWEADYRADPSKFQTERANEVAMTYGQQAASCLVEYLTTTNPKDQATTKPPTPEGDNANRGLETKNRTVG